MAQRNIWVSCGVIFEGLGVQKAPRRPAGLDYVLEYF